MSKTNEILKKLCDSGQLTLQIDGDQIIPCFNNVPIKLIHESTGYLKFFVTDPDTKYRTSLRVHRLVAYMTWGDAIFDPEIVVDHMDHNRSNNIPSNLCLTSRQYNTSKQISGKLLQYKLIRRGALIGALRDLEDAKVAATALDAKVIYANSIHTEPIAV